MTWIRALDGTIINLDNAGAVGIADYQEPSVLDPKQSLPKKVVFVSIGPSRAQLGMFDVDPKGVEAANVMLDDIAGRLGTYDPIRRVFMKMPDVAR